MPIDTLHPDYLAHGEQWRRIRDVLAGEMALKAAGEKYIPRLELQSDAEYAAYVERGCFYNATARTVAGYVGLIFRRKPLLQLPPERHPMTETLRRFCRDADLQGTPLDAYAKRVVEEAVTVGRGGTLIDWRGGNEDRAYLAFYRAEDILNWRQTRVGGEMALSLVVLAERAAAASPEDEFVEEATPQIRVLKLSAAGAGGPVCQMEVWQWQRGAGEQPGEWRLARRVTPVRRGQPLERIPFVFHGAAHGRATVEKPPIADLVAANLDHYRLNADYRHGMHFTALPTVWAAGFSTDTELQIGSSAAWVSPNANASAGYLEFRGDGLQTFERALDRSERLLTVLGSRLLESQKRVSESAEALAIRQGGESSIIGGLALAVTASLQAVLRWVYWWHAPPGATEEAEAFHYELNTDFETTLLGARELQALVAAWQCGAISRDTLLHQLRMGEILPPGRTEVGELRVES